jgi:hypothetical protein
MWANVHALSQFVNIFEYDISMAIHSFVCASLLKFGICGESKRNCLLHLKFKLLRSKQRNIILTSVLIQSVSHLKWVDLNSGLLYEKKFQTEHATLSYCADSQSYEHSDVNVKLMYFTFIIPLIF